MKNNPASLKTIFLKKMCISAIIQFLTLASLLLLARSYFYHNQLNSLNNSLIVNDSFTIEAVGKHKILNNQYALDLELSNIASEHKLDSIQFVDHLKDFNTSHCSKVANDFYLCKGNNGIYSAISPVKLEDKILGYIITQKKYNFTFFTSLFYWLLFISFIIISALLFNFMFLFIPVKKKIESNTQSLIRFVFNPESKMDTDISISEYITIAAHFNEKRAEMELLQKDKVYYEARKNIAEQVAHDIRSPLAAIKTALSNFTGDVTENRRIMIINAATRINDIANNLLSQFKDTEIEIGIPQKMAPELVFVMLDSITSEKRYEYEKKPVEIQLNIAKDAYGCFTMIHSASFKRVLSNLINNSMEAITSKGIIDIGLKCTSDKIIITIKDNGCGIPSDILPKITRKGFSHEKKSGAGIGLSYAKNYIEYLNGDLLIQSEVGIGTVVTMTLSRSFPPQWFCEELNIQDNSHIAILDDILSIHETWKERFSQFNTIHLIEALDVNSLLQQTSKIKNILYLIDYELLGNEKNGLDIIEALGLEKFSILVTSNFEDHAIRSRCEKLGLKIIPKPYIPYISIQLNAAEKNNSPHVLIDDDEMVRMTWQFAAENAGKQLITFESIDEFNQKLDVHDKNSIIYIDSNFGIDEKGEEFAKILYENGFKEIYLTTGYGKNKFPNMPWIKAIISKEPFFEEN